MEKVKCTLYTHTHTTTYNTIQLNYTAGKDAILYNSINVGDRGTRHFSKRLFKILAIVNKYYAVHSLNLFFQTKTYHALCHLINNRKNENENMQIHFIFYPYQNSKRGSQMYIYDDVNVKNLLLFRKF